MGIRFRSGSTTTSNASNGRPWLLVLFGLPFLVAGLAIIYFMTLRPVQQVLVARSWAAVPCTILHSAVETVPDSDNDGDTYRIRVAYAYTYDGASFEGDTYNFLDYSSSGYGGKQRIVDQYPAGRNAQCHVNPLDPSESVLSLTIAPDYFFGLFGLIFVAAGGGLIIIGLRTGKMRELRVAQAREAATRALPAASNDPNGRELKSAAHPLAAAIGLFFFGAFWNGITFTILYQTWGDGLFPMLFLSIFVVIGLAVIFGFFYSLLALFNPRPRLHLVPGSVCLGGAAELEYTFSGATHRIGRLRIHLEGQEEARYRRGTNTVREEHVFLRQVLLDTQDPAAIPSGRVALPVPEYSMHTFTSANNKIIWSIKVEGEIARWPDVSEGFEIEVLPLAK